MAAVLVIFYVPLFYRLMSQVAERRKAEAMTTMRRSERTGPDTLRQQDTLTNPEMRKGQCYSPIDPQKTLHE